MRTPLVPSKVSRVKRYTLEASGIFPVGVAMCTCAIQHYKGTFQSSPLLYHGGMRASTLLSKFCTVLVLVKPNNLSAVQNSEVSAFGSFFKYYI